jgi:hypothetical protein
MPEEGLVQRAVRAVRGRPVIPDEPPPEEVPNWVHMFEARDVRQFPRLGNRMRVFDPFPDLKLVEGKTGEELFNLILSGIREIYDVEGVVAGGAVRDVAAQVTKHKDVDVFLSMKYEDFQKDYQELGWKGGLNVVPRMKYKKAGPDCFNSTARALAYVQGVQVDLVFLDTPLSPQMVDQFPVYAQRGVWTLSGGMQVSPLAMEDIINKRFTIDPTITDKERLKGLLKKTQEIIKRPAYKDWKIVEPDIKEWWEAKTEHEKEEIKFENKTTKNGFKWWDEAPNVADAHRLIELWEGFVNEQNEERRAAQDENAGEDRPEGGIAIAD